MAQHYPIVIEREPQVKKSLERIGKYISKHYYMKSRKHFEYDSLYGKDIQFLSNAYIMDSRDDFIIVAGKYQLKDILHDFEGYEKEAALEVHYDHYGNINKVFFPL